MGRGDQTASRYSWAPIFVWHGLALLSLCLLLPPVCLAEIIHLKSGRTVQGKIVERTDKFVRVDFLGVKLTYYLDEIDHIQEEGKGTGSVPETSQRQASSTTVARDEPGPVVQHPLQAVDPSADECRELPSKLESCQNYECTFKHPFTGEMLRKRITRETSGLCNYVEEMPNGGRMECHYSASMRKAVAQYYADLVDPEKAHQVRGVRTTLNTETGKTTVVHTSDGKEITDPLQTALDQGDCVVSGYQVTPPSK